MPWMEVTLPGKDRETKRRLMTRLNQQFVEATGFQDELLYIRFSEFDSEDGFIREGMNQAAHVLLYCPRLRFEIKRALVEGITRVFEDVCPKVLIHLMELPYENIGIDGQLLVDADEELASRPFYYILPR